MLLLQRSAALSSAGLNPLQLLLTPPCFCRCYQLRCQVLRDCRIVHHRGSQPLPRVSQQAAPLQLPLSIFFLLGPLPVLLSGQWVSLRLSRGTTGALSAVAGLCTFASALEGGSGNWWKKGLFVVPSYREGHG